MKKSINVGKLLVIPYDSYSNYINLPQKSLERLSKLNTDGTYFLEIKGDNELSSYVGVKEFTCDEDCIEVPSWMAERMGVDFVNVVLIKNIPKGNYIKIEPLDKNFFNLPGNDKLIEHELSKYCLLNINQLIHLKIFDQIYKFKIIEMKSYLKIDADVIDITNIDLNVDYQNNFTSTPSINSKESISNLEPISSEFNMIPEIINEHKGNKLGGNTIDIKKIREERLKYYDKKLKKEENKEIIKKENKKIIKEENKEIIKEENKEIIKEEIIKSDKNVVKETDKNGVKPKRKYVRKSKNLVV